MSTPGVFTPPPATALGPSAAAGAPTTNSVAAPPAAQARSTDLTAMLVNRTLERLQLTVDPQPEGKRIEKIWVDPYNVFLPEDKFISWMNYAHFHTKERTVREELLFHEEETWSERTGFETARNLRKYLPLTVAQVVTCQGSTPGTIQVVVVTRDIWTLRFSYDLQLTDGRLEYFFIGLFEYNWLGQAETISPFYFEMDLATMLFAQRYINPRLGWSRVALREDGGLLYNYRTGRLEGGIASLKLFGGGDPTYRNLDRPENVRGVEVSRPPYSLSTKWSWEMNFDAHSRIRRTFSQGEVARVSALGESLPLQYSSLNLALNLVGTRSFGYEWKNNFSLGWRLAAPLNRFEPASGETYSAEAIAEFGRNNLPVQDRYGALFAQHNFFNARFGKMMNLNTMGLIEDIQLGPQLISELAVATPVFGMDATYLQPGLTFRWNEMWGEDDLTTVELSSAFRYQVAPTIPGFEAWVNRLHGFLVREASPMLFGVARVVAGARLNLRVQDLSRTVSTIGGNNFLRGFPSGAFTGFSNWGANLEIRSRPLSLVYLLVGAATFYDIGDAFDSPQQLLYRRPHQAAGFGVRVLLPQISTLTARLDVAFPIAEVYGPSTTFQFQQAF